MKVGLLTPSGWGNLGDAAIQDATIHAIRRRDPAAQICGFTLNPHDTRERHGIDAESLSGFSLVPGYRVQLNGSAPSKEAAEAPSPASTSPSSSAVSVTPGDVSATASGASRAEAFTATTTASRRSFAARTMATADEWLYRALCDARYLRRMRARLADFDMVLASGGGQVDDEWGGAWGHPWTLAKWATLTRSVPVPFRVLSVGLCHLDALGSRLLARGALRQADYVSFRDATSQRRAIEMGLVDRAHVVPDLAFSHPGLDPAHWVEGDLNAVAVGPMVWKDPQRWARRDGAAHEDYLRRLTAFVEGLLREGRRVVLLPGDEADRATAQTLRERIEELAAGAHRSAAAPHGADNVYRTPRGSLEIPSIESVEQLLDALRGVGSVVASRLHIVLLAAALGKPVLALSYDTKVDALADDLDLGEYRLDIARASAPDLHRTHAQLELDRDAVRRRLSSRVESFRARLERQYEEVLR